MIAHLKLLNVFQKQREILNLAIQYNISPEGLNSWMKDFKEARTNERAFLSSNGISPEELSLKECKMNELIALYQAHWFPKWEYGEWSQSRRFPLRRYREFWKDYGEEFPYTMSGVLNAFATTKHWESFKALIRKSEER